MSNRILIGVVTVTAIGFSVVLGFLMLQEYFSRSERLIRDFRADLASREFKAMYHDSSDHMKLNVTETEFIQRMKIVSETLAEYDPDIEFRRNADLEEGIRQVRSGSGDPDSANYSFVILEVGQPEKTAQVHISWVRNGVKPKLFDLSVGDADIGLTNRINTVAGEPFRPGE